MNKIQPQKIYNIKILTIISVFVVLLTFIFMSLYDYFIIRYIILGIIFLLILINLKKILRFIKMKNG